MDFLNKAFAQLSDLFRSMTPGARIASGLLLAVAVISLAFLFGHTSSSPDTELMSGALFAPNELPAMEAAFAKAGLSNYQVQGGRIRVPSGQQTAYVAALADANALPKNFGDDLAIGAKDSNPFLPESRQQEIRKISMQKELSRLIGSMRGIESAAVLYDVQTDGGFNHRQTSTASVSVVPQGNQPLDEERVETIRQVVAGAIAGLQPNSVAVADLKSGRVFPAGAAGATPSGERDPYNVAKRTYEKQWEEKIRGALANIPGATVEVNVELNPELQVDQVDNKVDPKPTPIYVSDTSKTSSTSSSSTGRSPGLAAQNGVAANSPAAVSGGGPKTETDDNIHQERNLVSDTHMVTKKAGLTPRRVTVTVGVLSSYYEKIWQERNPTPAGAEAKKPDPAALAQIETEEKKKIQSFVSQLIPMPPDVVPEVTPLVTIMTFQHLPTAPIVPPTIAEQGLNWLSQSWSTLGMFGLGLVSLVMLRSVVRSVPAARAPRAEPAESAPATEVAEAPAEEAEVAAAQRLKRRTLKAGPSLRDELAEIVREDPDSAANILRNWIGSAT
jgi:flagellar M-ring protein FliF